MCIFFIYIKNLKAFLTWFFRSIYKFILLIFIRPQKKEFRQKEPPSFFFFFFQFAIVKNMNSSTYFLPGIVLGYEDTETVTFKSVD